MDSCRLRFTEEADEELFSCTFAYAVCSVSWSWTSSSSESLYWVLIGCSDRVDRNVGRSVIVGLDVDAGYEML